MLVIQGRNVNEMWRRAMNALGHCHRAESRAGDVLVMPTPVMSVYERPCERVLFSPVRDANPFFHLMESLWMLAGRNDSEFLNRYVHDFGSRFGESSGNIHGAYGHRWRRAMGFDQLEAVVQRLRSNPDDRQCVIQMWDANELIHGRRPDGTGSFMASGQNDLQGDWRDRPCNTHLYLRVRDISYREPPVTDQNSAEWEARIARGDDKVLDLTVCCRSNDIVWGAYGANAVHFSMLQEYLAGRIGCRVGTMFQLSNNWHAYVSAIDRLRDRRESEVGDLYETGTVRTTPIGEDWENWDEDLRLFMRWHDALWHDDVAWHQSYANEWFGSVATPIAAANWEWKNGRRPEALSRVEKIAAEDWQLACRGWMARRMK